MTEENKLTFVSQQPKKNEQSSVKNPDQTGTITKSIGTGENAKNSFVYLTLKWSFLAGIVITIIVVVNCWFFVKSDKVPDFMGDIKATWAIITPLITLALGYAFGKSKE